MVLSADCGVTLVGSGMAVDSRDVGKAEIPSKITREFGEQIIYLLTLSGHQSALFISIRLLSLDLFVLLRYLPYI